MGIAEYFADAADQEKLARSIEDWAPMFVPGLLQTRAYATAITRSAMPRATDTTVGAIVKARLNRAKLFAGASPPKFWAVLDESVIRRRVLPPVAMAELLEHIAETVRTTRSIVQIVPETSVTHLLMMGMARIMTFLDAPPLVYTEGLHSGQVFDYPALVMDYRESYDLLRSSYSSGTGGECVEVADGLPGLVPVRDSKSPAGPVLLFGGGAWTRFVGGFSYGGPRMR
ncbi:DUF397 domain-containing protein [Streptomyces tendae]|uniref:DUF397 domain-containing protein n=1 Tax=Streptomyces tendae TaxID=1932 RepID=UPI003693192D